MRTIKSVVLLMLLMSLGIALGCTDTGNPDIAEGPNGDGDTDNDVDADTDSDADADGDADGQPVRQCNSDSDSLRRYGHVE